MRKLLATVSVAAVLAGAGIGLWRGHEAAHAAQFSVPTSPVTATGVNQGDLVPIAPGGTGQVANTFANAGLVGSLANESVQVPLTGFTITPGNNITFLFLNPAGTLATGQITFPAAPSDGERFCWLSTHTQTAVTMAANTGQSIVNGNLGSVTAGVLGTTYCWTYINSTTTWYRII